MSPINFAGFDHLDLKAWTPLASRQATDPSEPPPINAGPMTVGITMLVLTWTAMILRFYTRIRIVRNVGWDDITMGIAIVFFTVFAGADLKISVSRTEFEYMSLKEIIDVVRCVIIVLTFYAATITMVKLSLGLFLLRIIIKKWQKRVVYVVLACTIVWGVVTTLFAIFQCGYPESAEVFVQRRIFGKGCVSPEAANGITFSHGVVTTVSDFIFTAGPLVILRDVKMNRRAKILLGLILALGGIGSIASLVRFAYLKHLSEITTDYFVHTANLVTWSLLECGLGIAAGSLATLRPLFRNLFDSARQISTRATQYSRGFSNNASQYSRRLSAVGRRSSASYGKVWRHSRNNSSSAANSPSSMGGIMSPHGFPYEKDPEKMAAAYPDYSFDWACAGATPRRGHTPEGTRLGNETTITVGMNAEAAPHGNNGHHHHHANKFELKKVVPPHVRSLSAPLDRGWNGGIGREMVFETSSSRYSDEDDASSAKTKVEGGEGLKAMPKAYMI